MRCLVKSTLVICFLLISITGYSAEISKAFMGEYEAGEFTYVDKKKGGVRSKVSFSMERIAQEPWARYRFSSNGEGDYDRYKQVKWEIVGELEEKGDHLLPLYSIRTIKDSQDNVIVSYEKRFDYDTKKIYFKATDSKGKVKNKTLPLKENTIDDASMGYSLRTFVAHRDDKEYRRCYIISDKGKIYRTKIQVEGTEDLDLAVGEVATVKLRLIYDLGAASGAVGAFIPKTFVWHAQESPHTWLQYEGLETGLGSKHVTIYLSNVKAPPEQ